MTKKKRVLILGGGFAGFYAAKRLHRQSRGQFDIELVNANNYFIFQPFLPEVAASTITAPDAVSPLRFLLPGVKIRQAQVRSIDFTAQTAEAIDDMQGIITRIPYDHLILAPGQTTDLSRFPGLEEHALRMKTLADAYRLRNHIIATLEQADVVTDRELKRQLLTYVAVGAGFSGVETVGEMEHMISGLLRFYPNIDRKDVRIVLIEYAGRILNELPERLARFTHRRLEKRNVEVLLETSVESASAYAVHLDGNRHIETSTIVATIGAAPSPFVKKLGLDMQWGRIKTDAAMLVPGLKNVWAVGDAALIPLPPRRNSGPEHAGPTAQFATREGEQVADNIIAVMAGQEPKPFSFRPLGALASIGRHEAVVDILGLQLSGTLAWFIWRTLYLGMLPGIGTKLRVMSNWLLDHFLPRRAVQLEQWRRPAASYIRFVKGDRVLKPGMVAQGFYTVLQGSFDLKIKNPKSGKIFHRVLREGDHFGERVIFGESLTVGNVTAREDSLCMVLERNDFLRFAHGFKFLESYFQDYIKNNFPPALRPDELSWQNSGSESAAKRKKATRKTEPAAKKSPRRTTKTTARKKPMANMKPA